MRWSHFISVFIIDMPACACYHTSVKIARVVYFFCKIHEKTGSPVIRLPDDYFYIVLFSISHISHRIYLYFHEKIGSPITVSADDLLYLEKPS